MGATVFWVCHKWSSKEWWGWFVLLLHLIVEDIEEHSPHLEELSHYLELLLYSRASYSIGQEGSMSCHSQDLENITKLYKLMVA